MTSTHFVKHDNIIGTYALQLQKTISYFTRRMPLTLACGNGNSSVGTGFQPVLARRASP